MVDFEALVLENRFVSGRLWQLHLHAPPLTDTVRGGQFLMIEVSPTYDPLGRRAFAVADVRGENLLVFYEVVGRGTRLMTRLRTGDRVKVLGPLGRGLFPSEGDRHLLIGGGVGLAGLTLHGKQLKSRGKEVIFLYGARSAEHLGMEGWLREEGFDYILFTEDGSRGRKGLVIDALREFDGSWVVSACGPKPMLRALVERFPDRKLYLSLENTMGCGWGVCLGCVVRSGQGDYVRVCYEGPVFRAGEVIL